MRRSISTDFSQSDFENSLEHLPLPTDKSLIIDRRLESTSANSHTTNTPTRKRSLNSNSTKGKSTGPLLPPSPADSTMAAGTPVQPPSRKSVRSAMAYGDAASDQDSSSGMRNLDRGAPGDKAIFSEHKSASQREVARKRSQYYGEKFAAREPATSARERVSRESIVMADVRTNVIVQDEYTFITDLSYTLSSRYARPENSICVSVTHSACLLFGGSFEPAYTMTITALPSLVQPTTNKRNAALLQKSMEDVLGVPAQRGLIKFAAIAEENLATNGRTVLGEIEALEKESTEDTYAHSNDKKQSTSRRGTEKNARDKSRRSSMRNLKSLSTGKAAPEKGQGDEMTPPLSGITETSGLLNVSGKARENSEDARPITANSYGVKVPDIPTQKSEMDRKAERAQKLGKRRSFIAAVFGKA